MTVSFTADVDYELHHMSDDEVREMEEEIKRTSEETLRNQVWQRSAHYVCGPCKEKLAATPPGNMGPHRNALQ